MTPGDDDGMPWAALYRRALKYGISDETFWRMSPAALITVTSGRRTTKTAAKAAAQGAGGALADCP